MSDREPIYVTRPALPPLEEFVPYLQEIWDARILTNGGPMHQRLEAALCKHLGVPHISLFNNGTQALVTALQAADIHGEVITTPYSFVATAHSLLWNSLRPVFVDIDPVTLNLDPARIEEAITPDTAAIMPVHCYGHPCDVEAIRAIADKHGLKVIYDAAHAFGVRDDGGSVLRHGDMSVLSFHATKVFSTFEGGAIICRDKETKQKIDRLKNFGFEADGSTVSLHGTNGKLSEVHAAFGLMQLEGIEASLARRQAVDLRYRQELAAVPGISSVEGKNELVANYAYFPILVGPTYPLSRDALFRRLQEHGIFTRRYFHPLITAFPMYRALPSAEPANLPVATRVASEVICLPIYPELDEGQVGRILSVIKESVAA